MSLVHTESEPPGRANGYGVRDVVTEAREPSWRRAQLWWGNGFVERVYPLGIRSSMSHLATARGIREVSRDDLLASLPEAPRMRDAETLPELANIEEQSGIDTHCATGWHAALPYGTGYVVQLHRIDPHERGAMHLLGHGMGDTMRQAVEHALVDMDRSVERGGDWVEVHALLWAACSRWRGLQCPPLASGAAIRAWHVLAGRHNGTYRVRYPDGERTVTTSQPAWNRIDTTVSHREARDE